MRAGDDAPNGLGFKSHRKNLFLPGLNQILFVIFLRNKEPPFPLPLEGGLLESNSRHCQKLRDDTLPIPCGVASSQVPIPRSLDGEVYHRLDN